MNERVRPTKTGLFMTELLICVGVFSLCAAVCVGLFVKSEVISQNSADLTRAVAEARNAAECFKAAGGDLEKTAELSGGRLEDGRLRIWYDQSWQSLGDWGADTVEIFLLELEPQAGASAQASLRIWGLLTAEEGYTEEEMDALEILSWDIAALEVTP